MGELDHLLRASLLREGRIGTPNTPVLGYSGGRSRRGGLVGACEVRMSCILRKGTERVPQATGAAKSEGRDPHGRTGDISLSEPTSRGHSNIPNPGSATNSPSLDEHFPSRVSSCSPSEHSN